MAKYRVALTRVIRQDDVIEVEVDDDEVKPGEDVLDVASMRAIAAIPVVAKWQDTSAVVRRISVTGPDGKFKLFNDDLIPRDESLPR